MQTLDIGQVHVRDMRAWEAAISKVSPVGIHPVRRFDHLGTRALVDFVVRFAVQAQAKLEEGEAFACFADELAKEVVQAVGQVTERGVNWMIELLRAHWRQGKEIGNWTYRR